MADAQALNGAQTESGMAPFIKRDSGLFGGKSVMMWLLNEGKTPGLTGRLSDNGHKQP